ncbi:MAG: hypothetical protein QOE92_622, partial [Chloroflexota bacterium]|nr:hypothetical protein [Chloroflexota bacterium]
MSFFTNNWRLKLLAFFLALSTWVVVVYAANPPISSVVTEIGVATGPPPPGLALLLKAPPQVTVTIDGLKGSVDGFEKKNLQASIDLANAKPGHNLLTVKVENTSKEVTVRKVEPATLDIELDQLVSVQKKLDVRVAGNPAPGYFAHDPVASPDTVLLKGPQSQVQSAVAYVVVDVNGKQATAQQNTTVQVESPDKTQLTNITSDPGQVAATAPIDLSQVPKTVSIFPDATGVPSGLHIAFIAPTPLTVQIEGDTATLANVSEISTNTINLAGTSAGDLAITVTLRVP